MAITSMIDICDDVIQHEEVIQRFEALLYNILNKFPVGYAGWILLPTGSSSQPLSLDHRNVVGQDGKDSSDAIMMEIYRDILFLIDNHSNVAELYFQKYPVKLQNMLDAVNNKPAELVEIVFRIITTICNKDENIISSIGNDPNFVKSILSYLQFQHELVLLSLLKFLRIVVRTIRSDHTSPWITNLKECPFFKRSILGILEFQITHSTEELIITTTDLIKELAEINLNQSNLLEEIYTAEFNIYCIIFALTTCCIRMIQWNQEKEGRINLQFVYNWLSIMTITKTNLVTFFKKTELHEQEIFIKCLFLMLYPYLEPIVSSLDQQITDVHPKFDVISKYASLLLYLNRYLSIPWIMNLILMKMILNLESVLDVVSEKYKSGSDEFSELLINNSVWENDKTLQALMKRTNMLDLQLSLRCLLQDLKEAWLNIAQGYYSLSIDYLVELIKPFNEEEYFLNLLSESRRFDLNWPRMIYDKLKETGNNRRTFDDLLIESKENFMKYDSESFHELDKLSVLSRVVCLPH